MCDARDTKDKVLPQPFVDDMRLTYGDAVADRLVDALCTTVPTTSIRVNRSKIAADALCWPHLQPVPWCSSGYYLDERPAFTFDPLFHAGAYYVQEASSMFIEQVLLQYGNLSSTGSDRTLVALDLCAAPGGKSTLLRSLLPDGALLVCNEPMPKRAQVLAENMTKWGHPDVVVTQSMPADFTPLVDMFDLVIADVPCSGEGMFRKDDEAIADWSPANVEMCWRRQRDIIADVWPALREGGLLIYSTCTFNRREDEDNVQWIADTLGADVLTVEADAGWGVVGASHFLPGMALGEGFYVAALRKRGDGGNSLKSFNSIKGLNSLNNIKGVDEYETLTERGVQYAVRKTHVALLRQLRLYAKVIQAGVAIGTHDHRKGIFVPAHAAALCTVPFAAGYPRAELDYNQAVGYLRGESLTLPSDTPKGFVIVTFGGLPMGFVKNIGSRANNLYPDAWRIRTTHIKVPNIYKS